MRKAFPTCDPGWANQSTSPKELSGRSRETEIFPLSLGSASLWDWSLQEPRALQGREAWRRGRIALIPGISKASSSQPFSAWPINLGHQTVSGWFLSLPN